MTKKEVVTHLFAQCVQEGMTWLTAITMKQLCVQFCIIKYSTYALKFRFLPQCVNYKWKCVEQDNLLVALVTIKTVQHLQHWYMMPSLFNT